MYCHPHWACAARVRLCTMYILCITITYFEGEADLSGHQFLLCRENDRKPLLQSLVISLDYSIKTLSVATTHTRH